MSMVEMTELRANSPDLPELTDILDAVARAVMDMAQATSGLQETLSPTLCALARDDRVIQDLQALDFIAQHLCGIADFLAALAPTLPAQWTGDSAGAARKVNLSQLARRLGHPRHAPDVAVQEKDNALELFS